MSEIAKRLDKSPAQVSLNWLLSKSNVNSIILGASKVRHLEDNLGCLGWSLSEEDMASLDAVSDIDKPYPYDFLDMAKKLIDKTDDKLVQSSLTATIHSTGVVSGSFKPVWQTRIGDFEKWLADPDISVKANVFAKRLVESLRRSVELDEEDDWED